MEVNTFHVYIVPIAKPQCFHRAGSLCRRRHHTPAFFCHRFMAYRYCWQVLRLWIGFLLGTANSSSCWMLSTADKIIKLASILVNIALGGDKHRERNLVCRCHPFCSRNTESRPCSGLDTRQGMGYWLYEPQGGPPSILLAGINTLLMDTFMSQPQLCHEHQRRTVWQQNLRLKEHGSKESVGRRKREQVRPGKRRNM